jgi:hypothetical protein
MALVNVKDKAEPTPRERARAAMDSHTNKSEAELKSSGRRILRKGQHLDVDGILERSLPRTVSQSSCAKTVMEASAGERAAEILISRAR